MLNVLANRTYRHLLAAQVIALIGTGLATVVLGPLAYDLAGGNARAVLGTALAIKMVAYIGVASIVGAFADRLPRRAFLVSINSFALPLRSACRSSVKSGGSFTRIFEKRTHMTTATNSSLMTCTLNGRDDTDRSAVAAISQRSRPSQWGNGAMFPVHAG